MKLIGVDVGGTFTDLVLADTDTAQAVVHKVPTTPEDPSIAVTEGVIGLCAIADADPSQINQVLHGTTIATNAVLEHRGAVTGLITTRGYRDILHIGRHQRPQHYSLMQRIPWQSRPFVQRRHRHVVSERLIPPRGDVLVPLHEDEVRASARALRQDGVEAIAICFLFSYLNPAHEARAKELVLEEYPEAFVTTSAEVAPQFREFERFTTAAMNAFVGPKVRDYISVLSRRLRDAGIGGELQVMGSNGGAATVRMVQDRPVLTMLSGPAAGVLGGTWAGALSRRDNLITFDMGGTSADIGIVTGGRFAEATARDTWIGGFPILVPMIDIHTIGAGGGSIARWDSGGAFRVGPQSAGAVPGPAAYGRGGSQPTVTDANVVLGRLDPDRFLGGAMKLDAAASQQVMQRFATELGISLAEAALGILTVVSANMANAIWSRTAQRGIDPRDYTLVAFGGAGPLHGVEVARQLGIREVLIPPHPGITSAMGLLTTDLQYDTVRTCFQASSALDVLRLADDFAVMGQEIIARFAGDRIEADCVRFERSGDLRYAGQGYELRVLFGDGPIDENELSRTLERFHVQHQTEYGHAFRDSVIEVVNVRLVGVAVRPKLETGPVARSGQAPPSFYAPVVFAAGQDAIETPFLFRDALTQDVPIAGPAVVLQTDSTTVVPPGCTLRAEPSGNLIITVPPGE
jgi:N-methylhydantoinase A